MNRALLGVIPIVMVVAAVAAGARTAGPSAAAAHAPDHVRHSQPVTSDEVRPADATIGQDAAVPLDPAAGDRGACLPCCAGVLGHVAVEPSLQRVQLLPGVVPL